MSYGRFRRGKTKKNLEIKDASLKALLTNSINDIYYEFESKIEDGIYSAYVYLDFEEFISYFLIENPNDNIEALAEKIQQLSKLTKGTNENEVARLILGAA